jgi:CheY-like chemotaxis protein
MIDTENTLSALVIDDDPVNRQVAARLLARLDFAAEQAGEGMAGLAMLQRKRYDAVLLDIAMPGLDGQALLSVLRADPHTSGCYIVAHTGVQGDENHGQLLCDGFDAVLPKPITPDSLARALQPLLLAQGYAG